MSSKSSKSSKSSSSSSSSRNNALINDLTKVGSMAVFVHLVTKLRGDGRYFDADSVNGIVLTLLGFVFYHLVFATLVPPRA